LAGPQVVERFDTVFLPGEERDGSASSRLDLWADNWDVMKKHPVLGVGPDHWPLISHKYGWPPGKEGHSLWLQIGAELGFPGLIFLSLFYLLVVVRLWFLVRSKREVLDPWVRDAGRMVIVSLVGFMVSAQFVSLEGLELPYYVTLLGAGVLKLTSTPAPYAAPSPISGRMPALAAATLLAPRKG